MNHKFHLRRVWLRLLVLVTIPAVLLGLSLWYISNAAEQADFGFLNDISRTARLGLQSGPPVLQVQGSTIAVVWSDGFNDAGDTKYKGHIFLKSADEKDGYWRPKVRVFKADADNWAADPVAIFDRVATDTLHMVWAQANNCNNTVFQCKFQALNYTRCDLSGDENTCLTPTTILSSTADVAYANPSLTQDDQNNLHLVWTEERQNKVYYSRGISGTRAITWSAPAEVTFAPNGKKPQLAFSNGRLHLVWDDKSSNRIRYAYDALYNNDVFTATTVQEWGLGSNYSGGDPGNPSLAVLGKFIFIAFDTQDPLGGNNFALAYVRSTENGNENTWTSPRDIPTQSQANFSNYPSSTADVVGGLKPQLVITSSGAITHLNVVWQFSGLASEGGAGRSQIYHSWRVVTTTAKFDDPWFTPALSVTNPAPTPTPTLPPEGAADPAPPLLRMLGTNSDSAEPALGITDPAQGGMGKFHLAFLEVPKAQAEWDVHYRGFIAGTIDPEYITTTVDLYNTVNPTLIATNVITLPAQALKYVVNVVNRGEVNAVAVGITDTLDSRITSVNGLSANAGTVTYDAANHRIVWRGTVSASYTLVISFTATTPDGMPLSGPIVFRSTAELWNKGSKGAVLLRDRAQTIIRQYAIYMPVLMKQG